MSPHFRIVDVWPFGQRTRISKSPALECSIFNLTYKMSLTELICPEYPENTMGDLWTHSAESIGKGGHDTPFGMNIVSAESTCGSLELSTMVFEVS